MRLDHLLSKENCRSRTHGRSDRRLNKEVIVVQFLRNFVKFIEKVNREEGHTPWGCSSVGRAPALQAGGHGFESHHLHQRIGSANNLEVSSVKSKDITRWEREAKKKEERNKSL